MMSSINIKRFSKLVQHNLVIFVTDISCNDLVNNTKVEYFDFNTGEGYQRKLIPSHYRKIARYLKDDPSSILPSAIIGAIDEKDIRTVNEELKITGFIRLVDGQHRKEALKYLKEKYNEDFKKIEDMSFPLVLLVIKNNADKLIEITTFININSKGKTVKTDLALELSEKIRRESNSHFKDKNEFMESISVSVVKLLNEKKESVWYDKIKMAEENSSVEKPVGINTFKRSMKEFIIAYLEKNQIDINQIERNSSEYETELNAIYNILNNAWSIVQEKWPNAFNSPDYNLSKGLGIYPIHKLLSDLLDKNPNSINLRFENTINKSSLSSDVWKIGGDFSGYNSLSGFNKIAEIITKSIL